MEEMPTTSKALEAAPMMAVAKIMARRLENRADPEKEANMAALAMKAVAIILG